MGSRRTPLSVASSLLAGGLAGVLLGCAPEEPGPVARFSLAASMAGMPLDFADVPFPSDLYLDASGRLALGAVPSRRTGEPFFEELWTLLGARDGFSTTGAVHFGIDGELDPLSLTSHGEPGLVASIADGVILLDADPASPTRGALIPVRVLYDAGRELLTVRPARGFTFGPGHRWVAALTSTFVGMNGAPLSPSPEFLALRSGGMPAIDEALAALEAAGVARNRVAVATVFTTEHPGTALVATRAAVHATPAPVITIDRVIPGPEGDLDDFFGVPAEDRPGVDVPAMGAPEERAMQHTTVARVILGRFTAPRMLTGAGTEVGTPRLDASGAPMAGPLEDVPFLLIVPSGVDVSTLPVLVVHHGFNASRITGLVFADTAGRAGYAVLAIDAFQHGGRAEGAIDEIHNVRGSPGPDGLYETNVASVSARTFGLAGPPADLELFPAYPEGAFIQFAADVMSAVRMIEESDLSPLRAVDASLSTLSFREDRLVYLGISMGSVIGASVLAAEPDFRAFVLNVPPGSIADTLCEGAEFRSLATGPLSNVLGIRGPFDEVARSCANDPIVDFFRWALEPIDPLALAPHFFDQPLTAGARPDVLWLLAGNDQLAAPPATESMLAVAGAPGVGDFEFARLSPLTLPATANRETASGLVTAAAVRCSPCSHGLPEVRGGSSTYMDPLAPPLSRREPPLMFDNPIEAVHTRIETFLETSLTGAHATIE